MSRKRPNNSAPSRRRSYIAPIVALPHPRESGFCSSCHRAISMNTSVSTAGLQPAPRPIPVLLILGYREDKYFLVLAAQNGNAHLPLEESSISCFACSTTALDQLRQEIRFIPVVRGQFLPRSASLECSREWGRRSSHRRAQDRRLLVV